MPKPQASSLPHVPSKHSQIHATSPFFCTAHFLLSLSPFLTTQKQVITRNSTMTAFTVTQIPVEGAHFARKESDKLQPLREYPHATVRFVEVEKEAMK